MNDINPAQLKINKSSPYYLPEISNDIERIFESTLSMI